MKMRAFELSRCKKTDGGRYEVMGYFVSVEAAWAEWRDLGPKVTFSCDDPHDWTIRYPTGKAVDPHNIVIF